MGLVSLMGDFVYKVRDDSLYHAYARYTTANRSSNVYSKYSKSEVKNIASLRKQYEANRMNGPYKSPYYDPVARHERYMKEKAAGKFGVSASISKLSSGTSGGKGRSKSGSGGKGRSKTAGRSSKAMANAIKKLREESALNSSAQQEVTKRRIADLKEELRQQIELLTKGGELEEGHNTAEIRGNIQRIRGKIQNEGKSLSDWVSKEQTALARRIAKLQGKKYDEGAEKRKKQQQEAKDKEVKRRADAIYKRKTGK